MTERMTRPTKGKRMTAKLTDGKRWRIIRHHLSPRHTADILMMPPIPSKRGWSTEDWIDAHVDAWADAAKRMKP